MKTLIASERKWKQGVVCCLTVFLLSLCLQLPAQGTFRPYATRLDSCRNNRLYRSEAALCAEIMTRSADAGDWPSYVQAWVRQIESELFISHEAEDYAAVIDSIRQRAASLPSSMQPFADLLQGDVFTSYLQTNERTIQRRTRIASAGVSGGGLETWTVTDVRNAVLHCYTSALEGLDRQAGLPVVLSAWSVLYQGEQTADLQPATLYDLFAFHMLNNPRCLENTVGLDSLCLMDATTFSGLDFSSVSESGKRFVLNTLQQLVRHHQDEPAVLSMLRYALWNMIPEYNNRFTIAQLDALYDEARNLPAAKYVLYKTARIYRGRRPKREAICLERIMELFPQDTLARLASVRHDELCLRCDLNLEFVSDPDTRGFIPDEPIKAKLSFLNTDSVFFGLYRLPVQYASCLSIKVNDSCLQAMKPFRSWRMELPHTGNFSSHTAECIIEGIPSGVYVLAYSNVPLHRTDYPFRNVGMEIMEVSGLHVLYNMQNGRDRSLLITSRKTGKPVRNAAVDLYAYPDDYNDDRIIHRTFRSDADGLVKIRLPEQDLDEVDMVVSYRRDTLYYFSDDVHLRYMKMNSETPEPVFCTYLHTDRTIYRPGQTMQFSGLVTMHDWGQTNRVVEGRKMKVTLRGGDGREVDTLSCVTNSWGSFSGSFSLPAAGLTGRYTLQCDDGFREFLVEEYRRPSFTVQMESTGMTYVFGDTVRMEGIVQTYAGYPVSNAEVAFDIRQFVNGYANELVKEDTCRTDEHGRFVLSCVAEVPKRLAPEDKTSMLEANLTITSRDGETQTHTAHVGIGRSRVLIESAWPQVILPGRTSDVTVTTRNAESMHVPARLDITVRHLVPPGQTLFRSAWNRIDTSIDFPIPQKEHNRLFPWLADRFNKYSTENLCDTLETGRTAFTWHGETQAGQPVTLPQLADLKDGWYEAEMNAAAEDGSTDRSVVRFRVVSGKPSVPIAFMDDWFTAVRTESEAGGCYEFQLAGSFRSNWVLMEYQKKDTLLTRTIKVGRTPETIRIPADDDSNGAEVRFTMVNRNRIFQESRTLRLQQPERKLQLEIATFRDLVLPGSTETWTLTVRGRDGRPVASELTATLYDASLDELVPHRWDTRLTVPLRYYSLATYWSQTRFLSSFDIYPIRPGLQVLPGYRFKLPGFNLTNRLFDEHLGFFFLDERDLTTTVARAKVYGDEVSGTAMSLADAMPTMEESAMTGYANDAAATDTQHQSGTGAVQGHRNRTDFSETAFFLPPAETDADGSLHVSFTMPDALTRWHLMVFAHTKDLQYGSLEKWLVTQNPVAIEAWPPRIFRTGDTLTFTTRLSSTLKEVRPGTATLELFDAVSDKPVPCLLTAQGAQAAVVMQTQALPGQTVPVNWTVAVPDGVTAIRYRLTFKCEGYSDGEERVLPVLTNRILITESVPMYIPAHAARNYTLQSLAQLDTKASAATQPERFVLEMASNPIWYAVQALPYLMETDFERADGVFTRLFANSIASHIVQQQPAVQTVLNAWREAGGRMTASPLETDQDLKQALLDETPWVMDAQNEAERLGRMPALFDARRMETEQRNALAKLQEMQHHEGWFSWFPGMQSADLRITLHIASGLARLLQEDLIDSSNRDLAAKILNNTSRWLNNYFEEQYQTLAKEKELSGYLPAVQDIEYLYILTIRDISIQDMTPAAQYLLRQAAAGWNRYNLQPLGMLALTLHRTGDTATAARIARSVEERSVQRSPELGTSWPSLRAGRFWYENPVVTVSQYFEMFNEITPGAPITDGIRTWLLRQRQTINWETSRATAAACWMLLHDRRLTVEPDAELLMTAGGKPVTPQEKTAGTGWFRVETPAEQISPELGHITVQNPGDHPMWGAVYWQYLTSSPDIEPAAGDCSITRSYYVVRQTPDGEAMEALDESRPLTTGDVVRVRLVLHADQEMEYVHLKDARPAGLEPVSTLSGCGVQERLLYYRSIRDTATHFYISDMPRGTYVLEYDLQAAHPGRFSAGPATLQCYYAPQFSAHSDGSTVMIRQK